MEGTDRKADECVFIDDSPLNVEVASGVGIPSIRFVDAKHLTDSLRWYGVLV